MLSLPISILSIFGFICWSKKGWFTQEGPWLRYVTLGPWLVVHHIFGADDSVTKSTKKTTVYNWNQTWGSQRPLNCRTGRVRKQLLTHPMSLWCKINTLTKDTKRRYCWHLLVVTTFTPCIATQHQSSWVAKPCEISGYREAVSPQERSQRLVQWPRCGGQGRILPHDLWSGYWSLDQKWIEVALFWKSRVHCLFPSVSGGWIMFSHVTAQKIE